ncbi:hypothetical protein ACFQZT_18870 [Paenibacillus sp. GCM10027628]|uniref:hypothetical protein n=1 Tax=Paenibacillus sp. GCM10027628 TaxID=3273413 RepID=UPI003626CE6E
MSKIEGQQGSLCELQTTKYPHQIMEAIRMSIGVEPHSTQLDCRIKDMSKVEVMDRYLISSQKKLKGSEIRKVINDIYRINLDTISANGEGSLLTTYPLDIMERVRETQNDNPASTELDPQIMAMTKVEVMDRYLHSYGEQITGSQIRNMINGIFGVNLDGIASLDKARLSIFSKGQWISRNDTDIFVLYTGRGDVDLKVCATLYLIEKIGSDQFPSELHDFLTEKGFSYDEEMKAYHYSNPTGQSVSDAFKGQLIGTLITYIKDHYGE